VAIDDALTRLIAGDDVRLERADQQRTVRSAAATPKAFPWDQPNAFACNVDASPDVMHIPTATPSGSGAFGRVSGGRGETPQPPALNGNRFAIGAVRRPTRTDRHALEVSPI
jgi:hypothetical protein